MANYCSLGASFRLVSALFVLLLY